MDKRPPGIPETLARQIEQFAIGSWPCVVDPGLAEAVEKKGSRVSDLTPFPAELIIQHVRRREKAGASEEQIDKEMDYLMNLFERAVKRRAEGTPKKSKRKKR